MDARRRSVSQSDAKKYFKTKAYDNHIFETNVSGVQYTPPYDIWGFPYWGLRWVGGVPPPAKNLFIFPHLEKFPLSRLLSHEIFIPYQPKINFPPPPSSSLHTPTHTHHTHTHTHPHTHTLNKKFQAITQ